MQKHERECVKIIESLLKPAGFRVTVFGGHRAKLVVVAEGHGLKDRKTISSSPRTDRSDANFSRQWAQRMLKRVTRGQG